MSQHAGKPSSNFVEGIFNRHPALGCLGLFVLTGILVNVVPNLAEQVLGSPPLALTAVGLAMLAAFIYEQQDRERRRAAALKHAEQLKLDHPELAAVVDILDTYRAVADKSAATSAFFGNFLYFAGGVAVPIVISKLHPF